MQCSKKTMAYVAVGVVAAIAAAYALLPGMRETLLGVAPLLLVLVCPLSMLFMMKAMGGQNQAKEADRPHVDVDPVAQIGSKASQ
ncbi:DUF2933 domain-containing protein [Bordetella petrii]|uniref:DUF2933 domain-containing protein n=1 Tax=Bordetella petrii (strain ATCC BAA-461 / DSM 12804 / CCUG 43448 / CIP 107267 / Se-1111R) TaxID=340100 RepID=A9IEY8_BORPD|nr:DUF2933 domain-containing protein [Bordetella petrii]MBO1112151.1 DUF2933 domain-containing protein [Bordetella petrii]MBO9353162.1 DUF2933 domain-containing protein [Bordetella petrii]CAP44929.1 hypothetical protein Bpet4578 [Bordetella petrii]